MRDQQDQQDISGLMATAISMIGVALLTGIFATFVAIAMVVLIYISINF